MNRIRIVAVIAGALLLVGGAVWPLVSRRQTPVSAQSEETESRPVVQVVPAERRAMGRTVRLTGTLQSGSEAALSAKAGGRILAVNVREGQAVRRGEELVRLDVSDAQRQVEQAAA